MKPQRFGVVEGGFGANEKAGFVVLLDGVTAEPVFDAGVIVIESPEGLGYCSQVRPAAYNIRVMLSGNPRRWNLSRIRSKTLVQKRADRKTILEEISTWERYHSCCRYFEQVEYFPLSNLKKRFIQ